MWNLLQNTKPCSDHITINKTEHTVSRSSTTLQNRYHQHAFAICKEIEGLRYTVHFTRIARDDPKSASKLMS
jgi:hypothetical protein